MACSLSGIFFFVSCPPCHTKNAIAVILGNFPLTSSQFGSRSTVLSGAEERGVQRCTGTVLNFLNSSRYTFLSAIFNAVQSARFAHISHTIIQTVLIFKFLAWHVV